MSIIPESFSIGLSENGMVSSKTTRIQPPGGHCHINSDMVPQSMDIRQANRVCKPPGGMSSNIFSETESTTSSNESRASSTSPKTPQKVYRMASNFELGDEQPENPTPRRKPFKASGAPEYTGTRGPVIGASFNPLTGEMIGSPGSFIPEEKPVPYAERTPGTRIPPGGYTTPLW